MKLLIVAMPDSVHTARWILQLLDQGWQIYLFPSSFYEEPHALLRPHIDGRYGWLKYFGAKIRKGKLHYCRPLDLKWRVPRTKFTLVRAFMRLLITVWPEFHVRHIRRVIRTFKPDLIHSMEFQLAGALCASAKDRVKPFPRWLATNWGSDVLLFHRLPWAKETVYRIFREADLYSCECKRDVALARQLGFKGRVWPVLPNTGGFDLKNVNTIRSRFASHPRKYIMLKGYNGWSGRSIDAIKALSRCSSLLKSYKVILFSWTEDARIALELASQEHGFEYEIVTHQTPHEEILSYHAQARIYIGFGISDGISTSCLEAMAMGAFPIQSKGACCDEWFVPDKSGKAVPIDDVEYLTESIRIALTDDALCEEARRINDEIVKQRLDGNAIKRAVIQSYLDSCKELVGGGSNGGEKQSSQLAPPPHRQTFIEESQNP